MSEPIQALVVAHRDEVADGVVALRLRAPDGSGLASWTPGAHVDLHLGDDLVRQYSLCGDPDEAGTWRVAVLRDPAGRGGSQAVHDGLTAGSRVLVGEPRNNFVLQPAERYLFIAGGIGITPILPMLAQAHRRGADWRLVYGGRSRASMAFIDELSGYGDRVHVLPQDEVGLLPLAELLADPRDGVLVYCCGPQALLAAVEKYCATWPDGALHLERFAPRDAGEPVRAESFDIELAQSGRTLRVPPGRSILSVVEEAGIGVLSSCHEGTCGTCETGVLDGEVDHRDSLLTAGERAANDTMFICVSRARGPRLVLDL